jgi:uncharacterized protein with HEPN domain
MLKDDLIYVGHMLDMACKIREKLRDKQRADYDNDENLRLAVLHLVQTVGEAARRVSPGFQSAHGEVPWSDIIGMRHKVVHDYLTVDFDLVWGVATEEIPPLIAQLEKIVPPSP